MKRATDDISNWRLKQENMSKPSAYVFPQMPPRFRRCRRLFQTLFILEWAAFGAICFTGLVAVPVVLIQGTAHFSESRIFPFLAVLLLVSLPVGFLCRWLRHTAKLFWRCPCCGQPFPHYAPDGRHEELWEKECYDTLQQIQIGFVKTKLCPLVIPSVCPKCKCKFFEMTDNENSEHNFSNRNE